MKLSEHTMPHTETREYFRRRGINTEHVWIRLGLKTPEYTQYTEEDLNEFIDWFYEFKTVKPKDREAFKEWLHNMKLGVAKRLNMDYTLVKVELIAGPSIKPDRN